MKETNVLNNKTSSATDKPLNIYSGRSVGVENTQNKKKYRHRSDDEVVMLLEGGEGGLSHSWDECIPRSMMEGMGEIVHANRSRGVAGTSSSGVLAPWCR